MPRRPDRWPGLGEAESASQLLFDPFAPRGLLPSITHTHSADSSLSQASANFPSTIGLFIPCPHHVSDLLPGLFSQPLAGSATPPAKLSTGQSPFPLSSLTLLLSPQPLFPRPLPSSCSPAQAVLSPDPEGQAGFISRPRFQSSCSSGTLR